MFEGMIDSADPVLHYPQFLSTPVRSGFYLGSLFRGLLSHSRKIRLN
jgi:hypothetical protein